MPLSNLAALAPDAGQNTAPLGVGMEPSPILARIYGQPLAELPLDLYIPPDALEIMLEAFEGPLDLLLYLIRRANVNILDIPMVPLTRQYLEYIEAMRAANLELAADYLVMAATLIEIKSRMLLPRQKTAEGEETEDPRAELARRLLEYEQMRRAARKIDEMEQAERDFLWADIWVEKTLVKRWPQVQTSDLESVWRDILRRARLTRHHTIRREELSVREHMSIILRELREKGGYVPFESLFTPEMGMPALVVHFIAMLELAKEFLITLTQTEAFAPIYLRQMTEMETSFIMEPAETMKSDEYGLA